ncbi:DUF1398 family protein [Methylocapsa sp. S129]|uniref:DUF1398 family protein n=1 Tax=Methylocapsa sp. S129 TaxID=1641869 RepID=UPI001AEE3E2A|nr:DUF1398 family protein [Methylocapsa sp. S129]
MSMSAEARTVIEECVKRSHQGTISFGEVVGKLMQVGVETYLADYRRCENIYYLPSGETYAVKFTSPEMSVAEAFNADDVSEAVRGAQSGAVKYPEFMQRTMAAGCVGYFVWIAGRHVQYFGRRGEVHIERFPTSA